MKRFVCVILTMVMLLAITATASAATIASFRFNVPCQAIADDQLYKYHGTEPAYKSKDSNTVYISHQVTQIDAGETNRIAAYDLTTLKTMGAHWHPSDGGRYPCTSNAITPGHDYNAAGRGNTNYVSKYGLNTITLSGTVYPNL